MTSPSRRVQLRFLVVFAVMGAFGIASSLYILANQRMSLPFDSTYDVHADFREANGIVSGIGQPVKVVGVKVGQVTNVRLHDGVARVTLQIERDKLPRVYRNAQAGLEPITPLKDMQINLDPGEPRAGVLRAGEAIGIDRTNTPVPLSNLLNALDVDTRTYLGSLIASLDEGTRGRGPAMRAIFQALGPTSAYVGRIGRALAKRRDDLAHLIHNVAIVTRAASKDRALSAVVAAGDRTLRAVAAQDAPLRDAIAQLPATLAVTRSTLTHLEPFASKLGPTLTSLQPAVRRLPTTMRTLNSFARIGTPAFAQQIRPLIRDARPLASALRPTIPTLSAATPDLSFSFRVLRYLTNELAYNPPGSDEGFLLWLSYMAHNWNSMLSSADAHGGIGRAAPMLTCYGAEGLPQLQGLLDIARLCEK